MKTTSQAFSSNFPLAYRLSGLLAVVTLIHAAVGAFWPGIFRDPPMTAGNAQGTAVAMLFVALPALDQWFGHLHDPAASPAAVPIFAALTVIGLAVLVAYLRYLRPEAGQPERVEAI